jgi:hypothetical protein
MASRTRGAASAAGPGPGGRRGPGPRTPALRGADRRSCVAGERGSRRAEERTGCHPERSEEQSGARSTAPSAVAVASLANCRSLTAFGMTAFISIPFGMTAFISIAFGMTAFISISVTENSPPLPIATIRCGSPVPRSFACTTSAGRVFTLGGSAGGKSTRTASPRLERRS